MTDAITVEVQGVTMHKCGAIEHCQCNYCRRNLAHCKCEECTKYRQLHGDIFAEKFSFLEQK